MTILIVHSDQISAWSSYPHSFSELFLPATKLYRGHLLPLDLDWRLCITKGFRSLSNNSSPWECPSLGTKSDSYLTGSGWIYFISFPRNMNRWSDWCFMVFHTEFSEPVKGWRKYLFCTYSTRNTIWPGLWSQFWKFTCPWHREPSPGWHQKAGLIGIGIEDRYTISSFAFAFSLVWLPGNLYLDIVLTSIEIRNRKKEGRNGALGKNV